MYCNNCGHQSAEDFRFCPNCGAEATPNPYQANPNRDAPHYEEPVNTNPAAQAVLNALKDKLFFILCILMTIVTGASLLTGTIPIFNLLITVFLWLVHSQVDKNIVDAGNLRCVSGTIYAQYVTVNVCGIILIICGVVCGLLSGNADFTSALQSEMGALDFYIEGFNPDMVYANVALASGIFFAIVFFLTGAIFLVFNFFSYRYIHRFAKSVYQSVQQGVLVLEHTEATRNWLIVFAVFAGISTLGSFGSFGMLANGANCAACILASQLISKHLMQTPEAYN